MNDNSTARTDAKTTAIDAAPQGLLHGFLSGKILACFYRVYNALGFGFLESVYKNALAKELTRAGIAFKREVPIDAWYDASIVGQFRADFLIEEKIILEIKAS